MNVAVLCEGVGDVVLSAADDLNFIGVFDIGNDILAAAFFVDEGISAFAAGEGIVALAAVDEVSTCRAVDNVSLRGTDDGVALLVADDFQVVLNGGSVNGDEWGIEFEFVFVEVAGKGSGSALCVVNDGFVVGNRYVNGFVVLIDEFDAIGKGACVLNGDRAAVIGDKDVAVFGNNSRDVLFGAADDLNLVALGEVGNGVGAAVRLEDKDVVARAAPF